MKKEQTLGLIREALTALGALAFASFTGWESIVGLLILIVSIVWAIFAHEGSGIVYTLVRKLISSTPAILVELKFINPEQAASVVALLLPVSAMIWSYISKGGTVNANKVSMILLSFLSLLFVSCAGVRITPDGCVLGTYTKDGQTYLAGPCIGERLDEDSRNQIDRFQVRWENADGQNLRATYWIEWEKPVQIEYMLESGIWVAWDAKSGITIGPVPPEVESALDGVPEPVIIETEIVKLQ